MSHNECQQVLYHWGAISWLFTTNKDVDAENKFSIPPVFDDDEQSDEETDGIEEDSSEGTYLVMEDIDNASHRDGQLKLCLAQQLSSSSDDYKLTTESQEIHPMIF